MLRRIVAVASCAVLVAGCTAPTKAGTTPTATTPTAASPTQGPMQARWWQWATAEPTDTNPVADRTGAYCARNQPGDVWFLAGTFGGQAQRRCTVPLGAPIVAPAINLVSGNADNCRSYMAEATGSIQLDGAAVSLQRIEQETITFVAGPGNPLTDTSGRIRGEACGLWARIDPPSAGEHKLHIRGQSGTFAVDVAYTLVVTATSQSPR